jgi:uncharacterized protein YqgC (DUF456 family)
MEAVWLIVALVLVFIGLLGSFLPILPGPPIAWVGALVYGIAVPDALSTKFLVFSGIAMAVITALDFLVPVWGTKRFGGSVYGTRGSAIGMVLGLFLAPLGLILGPFFGALIGELIWDANDTNRALKAAIGSLIGFLTGVLLKVFYALYITYALIF